jgi:FKBP-type peptidyl-prolyl cis-trans isomerase
MGYGKQYLMRTKTLVALALIALTGVSLSGCGKEQKPVAQKNQPVSTPASAYDLGADSNKKFLADNAKKPGVISRPDGLQYRVIKSGNGATPTKADDMVTVTYKGSLINGTVFDQTQAGQTATFPAGRLIPGWVEALSLMKEGDEWEIVIPSELGYGSAGAGGVIPPDQTLVFQMTLISVKPAAAQ